MANENALGLGANTPAPQRPEQEESLRQQWGGWLQDPGNRAAIIQFGVNLMQPMGFGENALSHIGSAIGSAGEAKSRYAEQERAAAKEARTEDIARRELDIKQQNAASNRIRANAAQTRAGQGGLSLSQAIRNQRADQKDFFKFLEDYAFSQGTTVEEVAKDPNVIREFRRRKALAEQALGGSPTQNLNPPAAVPQGYTYAGEKNGQHILVNDTGEYFAWNP